MVDFIVGAVGVVLSLVLVYYWGRSVGKAPIADLEDRLAWYRRNYPTKVGVTLMPNGEYINYNLVRVNYRWLAFSPQNSEFLGEVEEAHPGLMKQLSAWDALTNHITSNGGIGTPSKFVQVLEDAGFEVKPKDEELEVIERGDVVYRDGKAIGIAL